MYSVTKICCVVILSQFLQGCVVGFSNKKNHIAEEFANVYLPAATDKSVYSGNASRLSQAIRQKLALNSDLNITSANEARWAIEIKIVDRQQNIVSIDDCSNPATTTVGNGAFKCAAIHPEIADPQTTLPKSFNHPSKSPAQERVSLVVEARAVDLNDGRVIWAKRYSQANIKPTTFHEIGDTDGSTVKYMQWTPDLHVLRYHETLENAIKTYAEAISSDVYSMIITAMPKKGTIERIKGD